MDFEDYLFQVRTDVSAAGCNEVLRKSSAPPIQNVANFQRKRISQQDRRFVETQVCWINAVEQFLLMEE